MGEDEQEEIGRVQSKQFYFSEQKIQPIEDINQAQRCFAFKPKKKEKIQKSFPPHFQGHIEEKKIKYRILQRLRSPPQAQ